ncbi:ABC transporter substrate-binding protein [Streptomyces sp. TRM66268-LWL]|uniref:ABC transporter substrate-binding protein n=1 Tax=Streptomyces polyasparticus TaxID=2767826 RepID=A0ABR7SMB0_9ACTN|nr:ABC transporter substrate-binding protein [Streptomyces polyasparticus]MBC9716587.1 ABC transporter substrate-binding protein [Streptomyces polyasparticus]
MNTWSSRRYAGHGLPLMAVGALVLSGCGGSGGGAGGGQEGELADGRTFTLAYGSDPGTLDPAQTVMSIAIGVNRFLYDPLIHLDERGEPVAGIARKWEATTTTASFTLRPGVTCSDGSPLTASDVAANIDYIGDPKNKSPLAGLYIQPGTKAKADDQAGTVSLTSGAPDAFLLRNAGSVPIACGKGLQDRGVLTKGGKDSGTGMFTLTEAVPGDHYTLTRRKDYAWGPGEFDAKAKGLPDKVTVRVIPNESTAANLLLSGELNAATVIGPEQKRLGAQKLFHADVQAPVGELFFNQNGGRPGADEKVRRALVQALNLSDIGKVITNGTGRPAQGMVTIEPRACTGDSVGGNLPQYDLAAAKSALDAAGWKAGAGGVRTKDGKKLKLSLLYGTQLGPTMAAGAELVQKEWQSLGAEVTLKPVDSPALNNALFGSGDWDVSMGPVAVSSPTQLVPFMAGPKPPEGVNFAGVENAEYQAAVQKAGGEVGTAGCDLWMKAEQELIKQVDTVPFYNSVAPVFGKNARFGLTQGAIVPSSIRMYAGAGQ